MTKEEALEILYTINDMYPRFNLTKRKAAVLIPTLRKMDYKGVLENLSSYVMDNPYPPLLSEIAAYEEVNQPLIEEMKKWEEEAKQVPPKLKEQFKQAFEDLLERIGGN